MTIKYKYMIFTRASKTSKTRPAFPEDAEAMLVGRNTRRSVTDKCKGERVQIRASVRVKIRARVRVEGEGEG